MTQASVSYQIKVLEDRIHSPLFHRQARGVQPTPIGQRLAQHSTEALEILRNAFAEARGQEDTTLVISVLSTFAAHILAPRIGRFQLAYPDYTVRINVDHRLADLLAGEASVAIRAGDGDWPGLGSDLLMFARYTPMLSPALLAEYGPLKHPSDLLDLPLIDATDPSWANWFATAGVTEFDSAQDPDHRLGSQLLEAQAALAGQGVCLLTPEYFQDQLERGVLVQPFDIISKDKVSLWLVYPERRRSTPAIRDFRKWLLSEIRELTDPLDP